jgi:hypothetical protein
VNLTDNRMAKARRIQDQLGGRVSLAGLRAASPKIRQAVARAAGYDAVSDETWQMVMGLVAITEAATAPATPATDAEFLRAAGA